MSRRLTCALALAAALCISANRQPILITGAGWGDPLSGPTPTPTATPTSSPSATPSATPTATPGSGKLFTESFTQSLTNWTNTSSAGGTAWVIDTGTGRADVVSNWKNASMIPATDPILDSTNEYCSFQITQIATSNARPGCILRAQGTPGDHYWAHFDNNGSGNWVFKNDASNHTGVSYVYGGGSQNDCACGTYTKPVDGEWVGIWLQGTGQGGTEWSFWNWGTSQPGGGFDIRNPNTWAAAGGLDCECSVTEVGATGHLEIDTAGACGPEAQSGLNDPAYEPNIDTFACGDTPPP